ncbi:protein SUPPRESSOR OF MAX2 1-like [Silene latifolia]|uniref:protein SUPPRESSOR OF MAX2 1-like n=1 Tax=Silene latifolia TaxID=37657 RepID=UPI003D776316
MRGGFNSIQPTLTPESSTVITHAISEANRRNHAQTTSLHVAATLLSSPTGLFRQACIRSNPNSSHPLQCRALELCFSVALERIPTAQRHNSGQVGWPVDPPISNSLMAALKRAQANQRRYVPEQQQHLLGVKVELEQLVISILDDPSVSRVMREASFSSPAVKAVIQLTQPELRVHEDHDPNLYLNPRIVNDVDKVLGILSRLKKRNPVLVGESEPRGVVKEVLSKIRDGLLKGVEVMVISVEEELGLDRGELVSKVKGLGELIDRKMTGNGVGGSGVVVDLGDLKWLVNQGGSEAVRAVVMEMGRVLRKFGEGSRIWFIGTATCETYLRCQVYCPTIESEWDLQLISIVAKPSLPRVLARYIFMDNHMFMRIFLCRIGSIDSIESLNPMKGLMRVSENSDPWRRSSCCSHCTEKYVQELAKLEAEVKLEANVALLPPWLQNAKMHADDDLKGAANLTQIQAEDFNLRHKALELLNKWNQTCLRLHPSFHHNVSPERIIYNPNISYPGASLVDCERPKRTPGSPVRTDLALGPIKMAEVAQDNVQIACLKDFLGCKVDEFQADVNSFKRLLKGLVEKVGWQTDAASAIASTITHCKLGHRKRRVIGTPGDIWLLFSGPDRIGKKKMAAALSELVYGVSPIMMALGSRRNFSETSLNFRGKTVIDRIAEVVRRNPFSVIMLQDFDEADLLVRGSIKCAMERGRLADSHGQEISLGNVIFIITSMWMPNQDKVGFTLNEEKLTFLASGGWQLRILVGGKTTGKRSPSLTNDDLERSIKQRKESGQGLLFDLNQLADNDEDRLDGSHNSSDLTVEHEEEHVSPAPKELLNCVDGAITFKAVDFAPVKHNIERTISSKFSAILGDNFSVQIESKALEKILSGIWLGQSMLESWVEKVLVPSIKQLKTTLPLVIAHSPLQKLSIRLELDKEGGSREFGDWLPSRISVVRNA